MRSAFPRPTSRIPPSSRTRSRRRATRRGTPGFPRSRTIPGICADALGGEPGVHSARFAGEPRSDARNNAKLVELLRHAPTRKAHYYCVIVLLRHADDPQPLVAEGAWHGEIVLEPRGSGGFGYDPYFYLPELGMTAAELDPAHKNRISHRGQALAMLASRLKHP